MRSDLSVQLVRHQDRRINTQLHLMLWNVQIWRSFPSKNLSLKCDLRLQYVFSRPPSAHHCHQMKSQHATCDAKVRGRCVDRLKNESQTIISWSSVSSKFYEQIPSQPHPNSPQRILERLTLRAAVTGWMGLLFRLVLQKWNKAQSLCDSSQCTFVFFPQSLSVNPNNNHFSIKTCLLLRIHTPWELLSERQTPVASLDLWLRHPPAAL